MVLAAMENFDFNAPVSTTIIYEDEESIEESIDIKPVLQENDQGEDIISSKSKTADVRVGLDTPGASITPTKNPDSVVKIGQSVAICAQISKDFNIKNNSDDKIENKSTREDFKKYVNVELVDYIKGRVRKINNNKEISDKVLETKINDAKNERSQNLSAHNKELLKILQSEKIDSNNDKRECETPTKKIKISQEILTVETSVRKSSTDGGTDTNCIQTLNAINCKNGSDELLHTDNQEDNQEGHKSKKQCSNELVPKSNDGPYTGIYETQSVSENSQTINIEIKPLPIKQITHQTQNTINSSPQETVDFVKKLLDTVSEHLIIIMNLHQSYGKLCSSNASFDVKEKSRTYNTYTKNRLFDLSYSSVVNIILPRKDDTAFVMSFLENTMQIAKSKYLLCSYKYIEILYLEMIQWVQRRQEQIQNTNMNPIYNATLNELEKLSQSAGGQERQSGKKQRISSMQNSHPNSITHQVSYALPGHIQPNIQNPVAYRVLPPPYQSQGNQMMQASLLYHGRSSPSQPTKHLQPNTQPLYAAGVNGRPLYSENAYMMQQAQPVLNTILTDPPLQNSNMNLPTVSEPLPYALNTMHPYMTPNLKDFRAQHLEANPSRNTTTPQVQPENLVQTDCSRSSISRDSGFISPLNFQSNNSLVPKGTSPSPTTTPLITHVTSLNPKATLSKNGYCKVCGKITKQKCLGCYNIYYCSHICQHLDWTLHQLSCRLTA